MSGDVQPRKRKDKKRKKDELGLEEPRGTAAVLGEGDVFIHSYHEHGTGGHWCAKIIFFSLLAILVTLIGLIILENRGLSELEANSVESRYSGVLEGWIDDAPEDDHHDEHTLELKHSDDEELTENDHEQEIDEDDDHDEEENNEEHDSEEMEDINDNEDGDDDQSDEEDNEDIAYSAYRIYEEEDNNLNVEEDSNEDDGRHSTELKDEQSEEEDNNYEEYNIDQNDEVDNDDDNEENDDENSDTENEDNENDGDEWQNNEEDHVEDEDDDDSEEVERIEREVSDEEILSSEVPIEETKADDADESEEDMNENDEDSRPIQDDDDEPPVERITLPPAGKPYTEIEEETIQKTPDTLAEEEEYEKQQDELRREREAQSSQGKGGGNSIEDDWPGEPSDPFWSQQLDLAEEELRQGAWSACERRASVAELRNSARAQWLAAKSLDLMAEAKRDNRLLSRAIAAYLQLLKMNEKLPDQKLIEVAQRAIDRIQFRGTYLNAEPVYRLLIRRFPDNIHYRNNLTVCFLMANRADLAGEVLKEALRLWPNDRVALAHYGFVLKNQYNKLEEAVIYLQKALEGDAGAANEPRFHYHLGDALLQLGRLEEAHEVHKRGTALGHFLSPAQRSLYNVPRLKSRPWWPIEETPYAKLATALENSWREILKEGLAAKALYEKEKEGLKERGEWSQLDIFVRGQEIPGRCKAAPVTCSTVRREAAAGGCRRGQVKFSAMAPGTHVRPHVGPTNCRLRMHLGLSNTKDTYIRVDKETRQWEVGKVFMFDDSFEHEVWHNGTGSRLVLIVDVWHPDLTPAERRTLPAI